MNKIQFQYDKKAEALYIRVGKGKVAKTTESSKGFFVDYDKNNKIIGVEILKIPSRAIPVLRKLQKVSA